MSEKILNLKRDTKILKIMDFEEDGETIIIYNVTHVRKDRAGGYGECCGDWYDIYSGTKAIGWVSGVKEVQEEW